MSASLPSQAVTRIDDKGKSVAEIHNPGPNISERIGISRIKFRQNRLVSIRRSMVKAFRNHEGIAIPLSVLTLIYSIFSLAYVIVSQNLMATLLLVPSLVFLRTFAFPLQPKLWGKRLIKSFDRLEESKLVAPAFLTEMASELKSVHEPELLVLRKLSISDTVQMMRLVRMLENIRPDVHQSVTLDVSGETSETISRVRETLSSNPNQLVVRV